MRRILWRHIFVKVMMMISLGMVTLAAFYGIFFLLSGGNTEKVIHISSGAIGVILLNIIRQFGNLELPDAIFIMPVSRAEREKMVKTMFATMCFIASVWFEAIVYIVELFGTDEEDASMWYEWGSVLLLIASISYLFMYIGYLDKMKDRMISLAPIYGIVLFQVFSLALIMEISSYEVHGNIYGIVLGIFCILYVVMDVWVHRKHFKMVVSYYAGYESSHHLMEKKVKV